MNVRVDGFWGLGINNVGVFEAASITGFVGLTRYLCLDFVANASRYVGRRGTVNRHPAGFFSAASLRAEQLEPLFAQFFSLAQ